MKNSKLLLFLIISFLTIGLFSCNKTSTLEGIEITKSPTKVEYVEGELFDKTGMIISLIYSDKTKKETTDYIVDKTEKLTLDDNVVTITSGKFSVTLNITVKKVEMTDVEVKIKENTSYVRTMEIAQNIMYREVFSNGTFSNWETCVEEDIISKQIIGNKLEVKVSLYIQNKEYEKTVSFDINDESISVKTLLTKEINDEIHIVNGVLVGIASTNSHVEYLLMDKDTKQIVGVSGLEGEGKINDYQLDTNGFNIGDELQIPVKLIKVEEKEGLSDSNKVYAVYQGGTDYEMAIISNNNNLKINKENVVTISNQEELINFLNNENRQKNFYQVVKLHGKLNYIYYASSKQYRIFFDGVTKLSEQKIENCSPCFGSGSEYYTTGKTVGELLFNEDGFAPTDFKNPASLVKDIYAVFIGGNTYYHEFVILSEEDIEEVTPIFTNYTFEKPTNLSYSVNQTFDLTGGCIKENYDYGTPKTIPLTTEMLEQVPDMTTTGKKTITGTYNNYQFSFEIEVIDKQVTSIALKEELSNNEFSYRDGVEGIIKLLSTKELLVNYNDDTSETINITENMISYQDNWEVGNFDLTITYMSKTTTINTLVYLKTTTVEEIKKETVEANLQYDLVGIIIGQAFISGTATSPNNGELLIKDQTTNAVIGIRGLITGTTLLEDKNLKVGDEIVVCVTLNKYEETKTYSESEYGKVYATAVLDEEIIINSHNNDVLLDTSKATNILCQDDLYNFLKDANTRSQNAYQLVKLGAGLSLPNYNLTTDGMYITYSGISTATSKIDGLTPYLHQMNQTINLGDTTYLATIFGETATPNVNFGTDKGGNVTTTDIYLMYIGGQGKYYHQFILLDARYVSTTASKNLKEIVFTAPTKQVYEAGDELSLEGGSIEYQYYYSIYNETINLNDVIGEYDMSTPGKQVITFNVGDKEFKYEIIIVSGAPTSIEIEKMPTITTYQPHTSISDIDLTGGILKVTYPEGTITVPAEKATLSSTAEEQDYYLGEVTFNLVYNEMSCEIKLNFKALTISEFMAEEVGNTYELTGVVVGPVSSHAAVELLIKEKSSNKVIGIYNSGIVGKTAVPTLDTEVVNIGDEIIFSAKLVKVTEEGVNQGKIYANAISKDDFTSKLEIISSNNETLNVQTITTTTISTQEDLTTFLNSQNRFYTYVKLVGVKAVYYKAKSGESEFYRIFFSDSVTKTDEQKINSSSPVINFNIANYYLTNGISSYFTNPTSKNYEAPATTTYDIYALFVGGNSYYHAFIPLGDTWVISK